MTINNKTIFVACDTSNLEKIKKIIIKTKNSKLKIIPKFGLQFFYSKQGRKFLEKLNSHRQQSTPSIDVPDIRPKTFIFLANYIPDFAIVFC